MLGTFVRLLHVDAVCGRSECLDRYNKVQAALELRFLGYSCKLLYVVLVCTFNCVFGFGVFVGNVLQSSLPYWYIEKSRKSTECSSLLWTTDSTVLHFSDETLVQKIWKCVESVLQLSDMLVAMTDLHIGY